MWRRRGGRGRGRGRGRRRRKRFWKRGKGRGKGSGRRRPQRGRRGQLRRDHPSAAIQRSPGILVAPIAIPTDVVVDCHVLSVLELQGELMGGRKTITFLAPSMAP
jgi:hypothetical protein